MLNIISIIVSTIERPSIPIRSDPRKRTRICIIVGKGRRVPIDGDGGLAMHYSKQLASAS